MWCRTPRRARPSRDLGGGHGRAVVAQGGARQAALLERLGEAVSDHLGGLGQIPLQMAGEARAVVENAEQDRRRPLAAGGQHLARAVVAVPVPQAVDVLGLVAAHLALDEARLGALGPFGPAWGEAPALVETVGPHEAEQRGIGRHRLEAGLGLGQCDEVVVVELDAPALVGGVLGEDGTAHGIADGGLLPGIGAASCAGARRPDRTAREAPGSTSARWSRSRSGQAHPWSDAARCARCSASIAAFSSPLPGGAAKSWPMTEKRKCAQRS